jgi:hypothetical protein
MRRRSARWRLSAALPTKFSDNFEHGDGVIARVRENKPATYLRIASTIIPKELEVAASPIDGLLDDELDKVIAFVRGRLQHEGGRRVLTNSDFLLCPESRLVGRTLSRSTWGHNR